MTTVTMTMEQYEELEAIKDAGEQADYSLTEMTFAAGLLAEFIRQKGDLDKFIDYATAKMYAPNTVSIETIRRIVEFVEHYEI